MHHACQFNRSLLAQLFQSADWDSKGHVLMVVERTRTLHVYQDQITEVLNATLHV